MRALTKNMMNKYAKDAVTTIHDYKKGGDISKASNSHPSEYGMLEKNKGKNEKNIFFINYWHFIERL